MSGFSPSANAVLATAEPLLIAVAGVLALVIVGLVALAVVLRRKTRIESAPAAEPPRVQPQTTAPPAPPPRPRARPQLVRGGGGGGLAVATSSAMVCPTCRTEYHGMTYCT